MDGYFKKFQNSILNRPILRIYIKVYRKGKRMSIRHYSPRPSGPERPAINPKIGNGAKIVGPEFRSSRFLLPSLFMAQIGPAKCSVDDIHHLPWSDPGYGIP